MSMQNSMMLAPTRRDRRATSYCDIWDLVAPEVSCPACSGAHGETLVAGAEERDSAMPNAVVEEHLVLLDVVEHAQTDEHVAETHEALTSHGDVNAQARELLSLLAS